MKSRIIGSIFIEGEAQKELLVSTYNDKEGLKFEIVSSISPEDSVTESSIHLTKEAVSRLRELLRNWG